MKREIRENRQVSISCSSFLLSTIRENGRFLLLSCLFFLCSLAAKAQYNVNRLITNGEVALHYEDYVLSIQYFNKALAQKPYLWLSGSCQAG